MSEQQEDIVDFTGHEPVLHIEDEGLDVRGYEIGGQFYLDFNWEPGSRWGFLDDEDLFREFVSNWLADMTGQAMTEAELESLEFLGNAGSKDQVSATASGEDAAADEESEEAGAEEEP